MSATPTITNSELQREVERELTWDPAVMLATVGVSVDDHTVMLSGTVHWNGSRLAAVRAAKRVRGVHAIADEIVVELSGPPGHTDHDIAEFAEHAMRLNVSVPNAVRATVRNGLVILDGIVDWDFQRRAAEHAVECINGVRNVINDIELKQATPVNDVHDRIAAALRRSADIDARDVHVTSDVGHVTLAGSVSSWAERELAERTAWSARGVTKVTDELVLR
jgi:osmotically-inducible protein OsmY